MRASYSKYCSIFFLFGILHDVTPKGSAAPANLDPLFGLVNPGMVLAGKSGHYFGMGNLVLQSDGKILSFGIEGVEATGAIVISLIRFNSDGSLDESFGNGDGIISFEYDPDPFEGVPPQTSLHPVSGKGRSGDVDSEGRIVILGANSSGIFLARFRSDGSLDPDFGGGDGIVELGFDGSMGLDGLLVVQDNKIIIQGSAIEGGNQDMLLMRFTADGVLDSGFGEGNGLAIFGDPVEQETPTHLFQLSDGKLLIVGSTFIPDTGNGLVVARLHANGSLDTEFGQSGIAKLPNPPPDSYFNFTSFRADLQSDGKLILGSYYNSFSSSDGFSLVRYDSDLNLDLSFGGGDGAIDLVKFRLQETGGDLAAIEVQTDGRILVAGTSQGDTFTGSDFGLARFEADGSLDESFDPGNGLVTASFGIVSDVVSDMVLQPDGKIVLGGSGNGSIELIRYLGGGFVPPRFANIRRLDEGEVEFEIIASPTQQVRLEGTEILSNDTDWELIEIISINESPQIYQDPSSMNGTNRRFYRMWIDE